MPDDIYQAARTGVRPRIHRGGDPSQPLAGAGLKLAVAGRPGFPAGLRFGHAAQLSRGGLTDAARSSLPVLLAPGSCYKRSRLGGTAAQRPARTAGSRWSPGGRLLHRVGHLRPRTTPSRTSKTSGSADKLTRHQLRLRQRRARRRRQRRLPARRRLGRLPEAVDRRRSASTAGPRSRGRGRSSATSSSCRSSRQQHPNLKVLISIGGWTSRSTSPTPR